MTRPPDRFVICSIANTAEQCVSCRPPPPSLTRVHPSRFFSPPLLFVMKRGARPTPITDPGGKTAAADYTKLACASIRGRSPLPEMLFEKVFVRYRFTLGTRGEPPPPPRRFLSRSALYAKGTTRGHSCNGISRESWLDNVGKSASYGRLRVLILIGEEERGITKKKT